MKIALINGSPKINSSASKALLSDLKKYILDNADINSEKPQITEMGFHNTVVSHEFLEELKTSDVWVFAYPLYVDGIPAHLLSCLIQLEETGWQNRQIHIYGIANCGFYEGIQTEYALSVLQNWCEKAGFIWSGGIGVGGGGGLAQMPTMKNGHGPKAPVEKALALLADKLLQCKTQKNNYVSVAFPRFLYQMAAQMGWRQMIRANGGKAKDLGNNQL